MLDVILSAAKDLMPVASGDEVLRYASVRGLPRARRQKNDGRRGRSLRLRSINGVFDAALDGPQDPQALPFNQDRTADRRGELNLAGLHRIGG